MALSWIRRLLTKQLRLASRPHRNQPNQGGFVPALESLGDRILPAVNTVFVPSTGVLAIHGGAGDNTIVVSRNATGQILVNGVVIGGRGGPLTVADINRISVFGQAGNDTITLDEANGALPRANLFGGVGNDTITGGAGADQLHGQQGNDTLLGKGGADLLFGGAGDDTLTAGTGDDQVFGQAGNDRMIWNNGDNTDLNEGGDGIDTVEVNGANAGDQFTITPNGSRVRFDRSNLVPFSIDIGTSENLVVNALGGDDSITASNGLATLISLSVDGGAGNDTIIGGDGADRLVGGDDNDFINGGRGNDRVFLGAGDDTFVWNPGDGSDIVEGGDGFDTMLFNGSNLDEIFAASANGERVRFTRDIGNIVMDLDDVEAVDLNTMGGADMITVNDLTGTDVTEVNLNLAGANGAGDGAADSIILNGTAGGDAVVVAGDATGVTVLGLAAQVNITGAEAANDRLTVSALAGDDAVDASDLAADAIQFAADGGYGDDVLNGGAGNDALAGGAGDDILNGGPGQDVLDGGNGDNILIQ